MIRRTVQVGPLGCNCVILGDEESREAVVVDPGGDVDLIHAALQKDRLKVVAILHTHAHIDHLGGTAALAKDTGAPTYLHEADVFLEKLLPLQAQLIGLPAAAPSHIARRLADGDCVTFGKHSVGVVHTPGHSPGSVAFVLASADLCLSGDTLFAGGVGRTDLWGGDVGALTRSIKDRLYSLKGDTIVVPGHGPMTTIDRERRANPFVRG